MKINLKIRLLRHFTGLDQQHMAVKLRIDIADYSKMEAGLLKMDDTIFENILVLFGLGPEQFNAWPDAQSKDLIKRYLA
jgi:hypothetical protein